jgi:hypothetical protein
VSFVEGHYGPAPGGAAPAGDSGNTGSINIVRVASSGGTAARAAIGSWAQVLGTGSSPAATPTHPKPAATPTTPQAVGEHQATQVAGKAPSTSEHQATQVAGKAPSTSEHQATQVAGKAPSTSEHQATQVAGKAPPTQAPSSRRNADLATQVGVATTNEAEGWQEVRSGRRKRQASPRTPTAIYEQQPPSSQQRRQTKPLSLAKPLSRRPTYAEVCEGELLVMQEGAEEKQVAQAIKQSMLEAEAAQALQRAEEEEMARALSESEAEEERLKAADEEQLQRALSESEAEEESIMAADEADLVRALTASESEATEHLARQWVNDEALARVLRESGESARTSTALQHGGSTDMAAMAPQSQASVREVAVIEPQLAAVMWGEHWAAGGGGPMSTATPLLKEMARQHPCSPPRHVSNTPCNPTPADDPTTATLTSEPRSCVERGDGCAAGGSLGGSSSLSQSRGQAGVDANLHNAGVTASPAFSHHLGINSDSLPSQGLGLTEEELGLSDVGTNHVGVNGSSSDVGLLNVGATSGCDEAKPLKPKRRRRSRASRRRAGRPLQETTEHDQLPRDVAPASTST